MMLRVIPLLLAAAFAAQPAQAGVAYSWKSVETSPSMPADLNLELVFSDAAISRGSLKLEIDSNCYTGSVCIDPQDSLLSLRYWFGPGDRGANMIDFHYRKRPAQFHDTIELALDFLPTGYLSGSIFVNNGESHFNMKSEGSLFTMIDAGSDQEWGCGFAYPPCAGSTGMLQIDAELGEVPEPSSAALAGLGLTAAWFARRRARAAAA